MKKLLALGLAALLVSSTSWGREPFFVPPSAASVAVEANYAPGPVADPAMAPTPALPPGAVVVPQGTPMPSTFQPGAIICDACNAPGLPLFPHVKVRQSRNIAPCAVPKIVAVPDPCNPCGCVLVEICVPPYACEEVVCCRRSNKVCFDYGKYAVNVTARRGKLIVNYDD